jgi:serine/threonine-protein kinase
LAHPLSGGAALDQLVALRQALADRYAIERELGQGGMATVYLAEDLKHHRKVAIKVLRPELAASLGADRFLREIETTAQLTHPHILPLLDSGAADGTLFYVMPYVEGESLRDRLTREKQLPLDDTLQIARQVADALAYAHSHGVIHRDIKPENILLESGHAVVADFGIAKALAAAGGEKLTETGLAVGTPQYMSPEQAGGESGLDGRSDLYSLGCVLYEMLAGEPPFTGPSVQAVVAKRLSTPAPRISILRDRVPPHVEWALDTALARTPADRFPTCTQFAEALTAVSGLRPWEHSRTRSRAGRVAAVVAGLLLIAVSAVVVLKTWILDPSEGPRLKSLVVLPLVNRSGDSAQDYFIDGMTEALITELGKVSSLTVTSVTSAMTYKRSPKPLRDIARELGVESVVEGSVLREGSRLRIAARLIDGRTDRQVWDSTFVRDAGNILLLYGEAAQTIAGAIGATLTPDETRRLQVARTVDTAAYNEYLLGRRDAWTWTPDGFSRAIGHYRRTVAIDPTFTPAYAGLAEAYRWSTAFGTLAPAEAMPLGQAAAERAVALDSASAAAHVALAGVRADQWRFPEADREYQRALALNPSLVDAHNEYGTFLTLLGRRDEAVREAVRARQLDPLTVNIRVQLGWVYLLTGRYRESLAALDSALALDSAAFWAHSHKALDYSALGLHPEALAEIAKALAASPGNQVVLTVASVTNAHAGRTAEARGYLDSLLALGRRGVWVDPYLVGMARANLGQTALALESFGRAVEQRSFLVWGLKTEILPASFKSEPRFRALLRRMGNE